MGRNTCFHLTYCQYHEMWQIELLRRANTQITKWKFKHVIKTSGKGDPGCIQNFRHTFEHSFNSSAELNKCKRKVALYIYILCMLNRKSCCLVYKITNFVHNTNFIKVSYVLFYLTIFLFNKYIGVIKCHV